MRTLILGMGNPILSDDGVGLFIAGQLEGKIPDVDVITTAMAGLNILDLVIGYDKIFVIDAVLTDGRSLGNLKKLTENEGSLHLFSSHGLNLPELLRLGRELGYKMPDVVAIYGIDIGNEIAFGEALTPELRRKMTSVVDEILQDIKSSLALQ